MTNETEDSSYGVPDKPEKGASMSHGGWIGGDSDAMLGVQKEKKWSKPVVREEHHEVGGEHFHTEWLGATASPVKKWKKPDATEQPNSDWIGGGAILSPVRKWNQSGSKPNNAAEMVTSSQPSGALQVGSEEAVVEHSPHVVSDQPDNTERSEAGDEPGSAGAAKQDVTESSVETTEQKMKKAPQLVPETPEPSESGDKHDCEYGVPDKPEGGVPGMRHGGWIGGDSDALLGVEKEKRWSKPATREEKGEVGGEHLNTDWLGVPASPVKKWKKPEAAEKPNSDWIGGTVSSPVKKPTKAPPKLSSEARKQVSQVPVELLSHAAPQTTVSDNHHHQGVSEGGEDKDHDGDILQNDESEASEEKTNQTLKQVPRLVVETPEPSETGDKQDYQYGVPDKPEGGVPGMRHGGWIGGDSDELLGVKKERRWSKPTTRQENHDVGGEHLNADWLGSPAVTTTKKWKKPEVPATEKPNSDWIGGTIMSPVRKWKQSGARLQNNTDIVSSPPTKASEIPAVSPEGSVPHSSRIVSETTVPGDVHDDNVTPRQGISKSPEEASEQKMKKTPQLVSETPEPSETGDKQDCEYGVPDKPEGGVPGMRLGGWIGGDSDALLGVEKEKRWSKPATREEKGEVGGAHLNTDWLGVPASPVKKWKKPAS